MKKIFEVELRMNAHAESGPYASLTLPATPYELLDALEKLHAEAGAFPDWEITAYYAYHPPLSKSQGTIYELNALAEKLVELNERQAVAFEGLLSMEAGREDPPMKLRDLINLACSTGCCHVVDEALNDSQLGRFCAENGLVPGVEELPDAVFDLLDFERIGREHRRAEKGILVERTAEHPGGYVERHEEPLDVYKTLDLTLRAPDYTILLEVSKGYFNDPCYDNEIRVQLKLPASPEALDAALTALDVWDWREAGWSCLDCRVPALTGLISDAEAGVESLNHLAQRLADLDPKTLTTYKALLEAMGCEDIQSAEALMDSLNQYIFSPQCSSPVEAAKEEMAVILCEPEAELITPHLNLYQYGQALIQKNGGVLTAYGLIERADSRPVQTIEEGPQQGGLEMK